MRQNVIITGTSSGLGLQIANQFGLLYDDFDVFGVALEEPSGPMPGNYRGTTLCDLNNPYEIVNVVGGMTLPVDILINNAGVNYIDWMERIKIEDWDRVMNVNARAIWLVTKALLENMKEVKGTIVNVVSNAAYTPMTHSIVYNASKGAAAIMTRQMARELQREHGICVFGISPNKLAGTGMSRYIESRVCELRDWTAEEADNYQLKALLAGAETQPVQVAELLVWLLSKPHRHKYLTGCVLELGL